MVKYGCNAVVHVKSVLKKWELFLPVIFFPLATDCCDIAFLNALF